MNQELQKKLFEKYPKIFADTDKGPQESLMCFGINTGDGWFWIINHLCKALQERTDEHGETQVVAFQVKQKFGGLRFYINSASDEQYSLIHFTELLSYAVCEECGTMEHVEKVTKNGWISTRCKKCEEK